MGTIITRKKNHTINERNLTKGQIRKLNALRKSVGVEIGNKAFAEWLEAQPEAETRTVDENAELIANKLWGLIEKGKLSLPRGGYIIRRGRGRVIVEPASSE